MVVDMLWFSFSVVLDVVLLTGLFCCLYDDIIILDSLFVHVYLILQIG